MKTELEELMEALPNSEPFEITFPLVLSEYEFLKFAHRYWSLGMDVDKIFEIKVRRIGLCREFTIEGLRGK